MVCAFYSKLTKTKDLKNSSKIYVDPVVLQLLIKKQYFDWFDP